MFEHTRRLWLWDDSNKSSERGLDKSKEQKDPTFSANTRVHSKHLSPLTLDVFELEWHWDDVSYIARLDQSERKLNILLFSMIPTISSLSHGLAKLIEMIYSSTRVEFESAINTVNTTHESEKLKLVED